MAVTSKPAWSSDTSSFDEYLALVRRFTAERLIPAEEQVEHDDLIAEDIVDDMRAIGLFGISIPPEFGGLGWSQTEQVRLTMAFTRASAVFRARFSTVIGLCSQVLVDHGTPEQRQAVLPAMAAGRCTAAFALTEVEAGSDAANVQTTATRTLDGYVISGEKRFITNAPMADLFIVAARVSMPTSEGTAGLSLFLVPGDAPGITVHAQLPMTGMRGSRSTGVTFDEVEVPADALVGGVEGLGLRQALRGINHARVHVAATAVGQADRLLEEAVSHAMRRHQFGCPIIDFQSIEDYLSDSFAEIEAGRALVESVASTWDAAPEPPAAQVSAAKLYCTEMVNRVADRAVQVLGGDGFVGYHPVSRMWRDVRVLRIFEGSSEIHRRRLGKHLRHRFPTATTNRLEAR